jgi:SAM-dependent methyltransferase
VRNDLSEIIESILGDAVGPGTFLDATRQHLSTYTWDHYNDLNPYKNSEELPISMPSGSSIVNCLEAGMKLIEDNSDNQNLKGPVIDIGCSVGRTAFELAEKFQTVTLGIDVNFSMLRAAQKVLREGIVRYPLKRIGVVYDRQEFNVAPANPELVDFWACDALALPFAENTFEFASALNVFDSVTSPRDLLVSIGQLLKPSSFALLATPFDWSPAATPIETWIGGHSQRGPDRGAAEPLLRNLLTAGAHPQSVSNLLLKGEIPNHPWIVRVHERSQTLYRTHIFTAQAIESSTS